MGTCGGSLTEDGGCVAGSCCGSFNRRTGPASLGCADTGVMAAVALLCKGEAASSLSLLFLFLEAIEVRVCLLAAGSGISFPPRRFFFCFFGAGGFFFSEAEEAALALPRRVVRLGSSSFLISMIDVSFCWKVVEGEAVRQTLHNEFFWMLAV